MNSPTGQILVLEDDPSWQEIYKEIASDLGYAVHVAENAQDGVTKLARRLCHLAIVDLSLVLGDPQNREGMEVLRCIQYMNEGTKALVSTGYATPTVVRDVFTEGDAFDFIEKLGSEELLNRELEVLQFLDKGTDVMKIPDKIQRGVALAKGAMMARPVYPSVRIKGLEPSKAAEILGTPWTKLHGLLETLLYRANDLLESPERLDNWGSVEGMSRPIVSLELPRLLEHRSPAKVLPRADGAIIVIRYWDRIFERPLVIRLRRRSHMEREYDFFAAHPQELKAMGFVKIGRPWYEGDLGGLVYVTDESDSPFGEFEHPWPFLAGYLQNWPARLG